MLQNYKTHLSKKLQLTSDVYLYRFKLIDPPAISFVPGQYLILFVPQDASSVIPAQAGIQTSGSQIKSGMTYARRLYSIASANTLTDEFELLVKLIPNGCASRYLEKLEVGSEASFQGPAGMFTLRESQRDKVVLVTGTGYAPLRSMLLSSQFSVPSSQFYLFLGFPYYKNVFLLDELKNYELRITNFKFFICLSREQNLDMVPEGDKKYFLLGRVTNGFEETITNYGLRITDFDYYLCSGREVVESLKQYLYEKGAPKQQVYFEKF